MKNVKEQLGKEVCLLFFTPSPDATQHQSRAYGVCKATVLKKFENVFNFKKQANVSDVVTIGEKALESLFGGKPGVGLNNLR